MKKTNHIRLLNEDIWITNTTGKLFGVLMLIPRGTIVIRSKNDTEYKIQKPISDWQTSIRIERHSVENNTNWWREIKE